jgi:hypothetical protein
MAAVHVARKPLIMGLSSVSALTKWTSADPRVEIRIQQNDVLPDLNVTTARKMIAFNIPLCINLLKMFTSYHLSVNIPDINVTAI